jgi:hypothetical protein
MSNTATWTETGNGYRSKTIKRGNVTVVVHRPILSDKERVKRENLVETTLAHYARQTKGTQSYET